MLKSSKGICLSNNGQRSVKICIWCMGPSLCWRYHETRKSKMKSNPLGVKWLRQLSWPTLQLIRRYLDYIYIHTLHKVFHHQLAITWNLAVLLTSNTVNETVSPSALYILPYSSTRAHQNSYFSTAILSDCNLLPVASYSYILLKLQILTLLKLNYNHFSN